MALSSRLGWLLLLLLLLLLELLPPHAASTRQVAAATPISFAFFTSCSQSWWDLCSAAPGQTRQADFRSHVDVKRSRFASPPDREGIALGSIVVIVSADEPTIEDLERRQRDMEQAERESLDASETEAEADRHRRRADKAHYLREKLLEQESSEHEAEDEHT
jgi:hypothetical protein